MFRKRFKTVKHISITVVMQESKNRRNSQIRVQSQMIRSDKVEWREM